MGDNLEHTVGNHAGRLDIMEGRLQRIEDRQQEILEAVNKAKGGWLVVAALGAIAGAAGGTIIKVIAFLGKAGV